MKKPSFEVTVKWAKPLGDVETPTINYLFGDGLPPPGVAVWLDGSATWVGDVNQYGGACGHCGGGDCSDLDRNRPMRAFLLFVVAVDHS